MTEPAPPPIPELLGVVGAGAIACGLAAVAARHGQVLLLARSDEAAARARQTVDRVCGRISGEVNAAHVEIVTDVSALASATFVVEAVIEDQQVKSELLARLGRHLDPDAVLATTTSSLSVGALALASARPERFVGLHVFNPVPRMKLVELAFAAQTDARTRERARALCVSLDKTAVEVPDVPGFVVNRLLFPYLFNAVALLERTGMSPEDIDTCMALGAGHPMGPLALLDLVGLDVSAAIGEAIGEPVPTRLGELIAEGALGRKSGRGFLSY